MSASGSRAPWRCSSNRSDERTRGLVRHYDKALKAAEPKPSKKVRE
jgi:hypothetical protein